MYTPSNEIYKKGLIYNQLINFMNEGVWVGDKDERTLYANPKFCQMVGYSLEEMIGRESYDFWDEESKEKVKDINNTERKDGKASSYEGFLLTRHGKRIPVLLSGAPLPDGGTIGIMTDLTEIKKGEKTGKILSQALEHAGDGIILLNSCGEILSWNHGAKKIFGYKKEEVEKKNITFLFPSLDERSFHNVGGDFIGLELIAEHKTDGERMLQVSIMNLFQSDDGKEESSLCIIRDITLLKRSELELSSRYQKIKDAYEWLGVIQRQNDYLNDLISLTLDGYDRKKVFGAIAHTLTLLSNTDACEIRVYHEEKKSLELISHFGFDGNMRSYKSIPFDDSWGKIAYEFGAPYYTIDLSEQKKIPLVKYFMEENFTSAVTFGIHGKSSCNGSITLLSVGENALNVNENTFFRKYMNLVEVVIASMND